MINHAPLVAEYVYVPYVSSGFPGSTMVSEVSGFHRPSEVTIQWSYANISHL